MQSISQSRSTSCDSSRSSVLRVVVTRPEGVVSGLGWNRLGADSFQLSGAQSLW